MGDNLQWIDFFDHVGGKNTRDAVTATPIFDATDQINIENIVRAGFKKIRGYTRFVEAPLLASGTIARGLVDLDAESDAWTGSGDATTFSTSGGIGTINEGAGAAAHQYYSNAEAGLVNGADAAYETRISLNSGGTLSGVYGVSVCVLDNATKRFELVFIQTAGTKQLAVLTSTADRTVIASYNVLYRANLDWTTFARIFVSWDGGGNITVYVNDLQTAFITVPESALPASTESSRVAIGSKETATVVAWNFDYIAYKIGSTSLDTAPITGIYSFVDETDAEEVLATSGTKLYRYLSTTADLSEITGGTAFTSGAKPHFVTFNDTSASNSAITIITTESRDTPQKYGGGGTKANLGGSPPAGKFLAIYNERLFIANTATEPSGIFFSGLGDPEDRDDASGTWDTTNDIILVERHKYGPIMGLIVSNNMLLIFSQRGIHRLQGWGKGSFLLEEVSATNGLRASNSLIEGTLGKYRKGVYFRDVDGYYWTDGQIGNVVRVSEKLLTEIDEGFNLSLANNDAAFVDKKRNLVGWGVSLGSGLTNSRVYALDYINAAKNQQDGGLAEGWFPFGINLRAAGVVRESISEDRVLFSDHQGLVYKLNNGDTFDGADYEGYRTTAWIKPRSYLDNFFRYIIVYCKATGDHNLDISWGINFQDDFSDVETINLSGTTDLLGSSFVLGTSLLGSVGVIYKQIDIDVVAKSIRFKFSTSNKNEPFTILGFSVGIEQATFFDNNVV